MTKEENKEMEELSLQVFKSKYAWKKLIKQGIMTRQMRRGQVVRRYPLTIEGCKQYMIKTLEMREKIKQDIEKKDDENKRSNISE